MLISNFFCFVLQIPIRHRFFTCQVLNALSSAKVCLFCCVSSKRLLNLVFRKLGSVKFVPIRSLAELFGLSMVAKVCCFNFEQFELISEQFESALHFMLFYGF